MIIVDENGNYSLESIHVPTISTHFWVLDLQQLDFMLSPLEILEETTCPSLQLHIAGHEFYLPADWNVLVVDEDTSQLDIVSVEDIAGSRFSLFVYDNVRSSGSGLPAKITNYHSDLHNVSPSLNRHHMVCCPIADNKWICAAPNDGYTKYLKNLVMGDIL